LVQVLVRGSGCRRNVSSVFGALNNMRWLDVRWCKCWFVAVADVAMLAACLVH